MSDENVSIPQSSRNIFESSIQNYLNRRIFMKEIMKKYNALLFSFVFLLLLMMPACSSDGGTTKSEEKTAQSLVLAKEIDGDDGRSVVEEVEEVEAEFVIPDFSEEEQTAVDAFALVYDSNAVWEGKALHIENSDLLQASNEQYRDANESMGGISLRPTGAKIEGDIATIIYDVLFGVTPAYESLERTITRVDGVWRVSRDDYCGFLSSARTPCS